MFRVLLLVMLACCGQAGAAAAWFGDPGDTGELSRDLELLERLLDTRELERSNGDDEATDMTEINIVGKPTSQSSTLPYKNTALSSDLANDGNSDPNLPESVSCTHTRRQSDPTWTVHLEDMHRIGMVKIVNRGDVASERLAGATVHVSPDLENVDKSEVCGSPVTGAQAAVLGATVTIECTPPINGRFIAINIPVSSAVLTLCEVRVWEAPPVTRVDCASSPCTNGANCEDGVDQFTCTCVAGFTGTTCAIEIKDGLSEVNLIGLETELSTHHMSPAFAIDRNIATCVHTKSRDDYPAFTVSFPSNFRCIKAVEITNVADETSVYLQGARVSLYSSGDIKTSPICGQTVTAEQASVPGAVLKFECDPPRKTVVVAVMGTPPLTILQFCEVRVWELPMEKCNPDKCKSNPCKNGGTCVDEITCTCVAGFTGQYCETVLEDEATDMTEINIVGNPTAQSSTVSYKNTELSSSLANDGNGSPNLVEGVSCTQTETESNPAWYVQLGDAHRIGMLKIVNRGDKFSERLEGATVRVSPEIKNMEKSEVCGSPVTAEQAAVLGATITIECSPPITGRFILIQIPRSTAILTLCEVRVWEAAPVAIIDCASSPCKNDANCVDGVNQFTCTCAAGFTGTTCAIEIKDGLSEVILIGEPAGLSSGRVSAGLAIDGSATTCVRTESQDDQPGWGMVVPSGPRCIKAVEIINIVDDTSVYLQGARVVPFLSEEDRSPPSCGQTVTADQASVPGAVVTFECDPPRKAIYLAVMGTPPQTTILQLCEVRVWELPMEKCTPDKCKSDPCENGGTCVNGVDQFTCTCVTGFTGTMCQTDLSTVVQLDIVGMLTRQSSTYVYKGTPWASSLAVDGNTNTDVVKGMSCSHTIGGRNNPWWYVDLGKTHNIKLVKIVNRGDAGANSRLAGARVYVETQLSNPIQITDLTNICGSPVTVQQAEVPGATVPVECDQPINGRYIAIAIPRDNVVLQLCEVMVWEEIGECKSSPCKNGATCVDGVNQFTCTCAAGFTGPTCGVDLSTVEPGQLVIVGKPTRQSSTYTDFEDSFTSSLAVDGNTNSNLNEGKSCSYTNGETNPWWYVDLEDTHTIKTVKIVNRLSSLNGRRLAGALVFVETVLPDPLNILELTNICGSAVTMEQAKVGGATVPIECDPPINGRYVVIGIPKDAAFLQLCEVMVWEDIDECKPNPCKNGAACVNGVDEFSCTCTAGFTGTLCDDYIDECESSPCKNGANCVDGVNQFTCTCAAGFTGPTCDTDIDECESSPCKNGGACEDGVNQFTCTCVAGFTGPTCETDIDECKGDPCKNGGTCTHGVDTFACKCAAGYTGTTCETDIDECESSPCKNGGACEDGVDQFTCTCAAGFNGPTCETDIDECIGDPCKNGGICTHGVDTFACKCAAGYTGTTCETDIDECKGDPCKNGGTCTHGVDTFTCKCVPGYTGTTCETDIQECESSPCKNGGACEDGVDQFTCTCAAGFTGTLCETDIDECESSPCKNGGNCKDGVNQFTCTCAAGFTGPTCDTDIDECESSPCKYGAACVDGVDQFTCTCAAGFTGPTCETDIDECIGDPCKNGGTCTHGVDTFVCKCAAGYTGTTCETDIDECIGDPCKNGGTCTHGVDTFVCKCAAGYTGTTCETDIDECKGDPCKNGGTCTHGVDTFTCKCAAGYAGTTCETDVQECESSPCKNGAACVDGVNQFTCTCAAGFTGPTCETDIDECETQPCQHGICLDKANGFTCQCTPGYEGELCEIDIDECKSDPCKNGGTCTHGVDMFACKCAAGYTGTTCETDINDCRSIPCQHGICVDKANSFTCQCSLGYEGESCEINIDECKSGPCQHGGECIDGIDVVKCVCQSRYTGILCETKVTPPPQPLVPQFQSSGGIQVSAIQLHLSVEYCIRKVVVHTRGDCTSDCLTGAVVRGGRSPFGMFNGICGAPLTAKRALEQRSFIDFNCDPPLSANYIAVDMPSIHISMQQLCEITIQESTPGPC